MIASTEHIKEIISYLDKNLVKKRKINKFKRIGPREFIYSDNIDTIIVKILDNQFVLISGGIGATDRINITHISYIHIEEFSKEELEEMFNKTYLQPILHCF